MRLVEYEMASIYSNIGLNIHSRADEPSRFQSMLFVSGDSCEGCRSHLYHPPPDSLLGLTEYSLTSQLFVSRLPLLQLPTGHVTLCLLSLCNRGNIH